MKHILMAVYNAIEVDARVIRAAETLAMNSFKVTVISCNSNKNYSNNLFENIIYTSKRNGPSLLIGFWYYVINYCLRNKRNIDCFYMHDYFMPYIGKLVKLTTRKPFIYDAHELLFQKKRKGYSLREKFFLLLEKVSIHDADLVISANNERLKIIRRIYRLKNVISVGNISKRKEVTIVPIQERDKLIVYQGILSEERNISLYIRVLKLLPEDIKLKLIGNGPDLLYYKKLVEELCLKDRVIFTGKIPYNQLLEESAKCRIGIVNYLMDDLNNYYCSPNKLFEYIQANIPVICSPQPFLIDSVKKYHIGEIWDWRMKDIYQLSDIILKMMSQSTSYCTLMEKFNHDNNHENEMGKLSYYVKKLLD